MSLGVDSGRVSCAPGGCTPQTSRTTPTVAATHARVGRRLRRPISISEAPLVLMSSATGDHVLRLDRRGLVPPAGALIAEDRRHLLVGELVGEGRHGGRV